jgi:hypothetical protein
VYFWGTAYLHPDTHPIVRCLVHCKDGWTWGGGWLNLGFYPHGPAAVFVP